MPNPSAIDIISRHAHADGTGWPASYARFYAASRAAVGLCDLFQYGQVVFTVDLDGMVHIYSDGVGPELLKASSLFMKDVWAKTGHATLTAPTKHPGVILLAERFGWRITGSEVGFTILSISRPST